jgi:hypothetical protein
LDVSAVSTLLQPMRRWQGDDEAWLANVAKGKRTEAVVAWDALSEGLTVTWLQPNVLSVDEQRAAQRNGQSSEPDLVLNDHGVEVKGRNATFTGVADFPFETALVGRRSRWQRDAVDATALVIVSLRTWCKVVVPVRYSRSRWVVERRHDGITGELEVNYACPRDELRSWHSFVAYLRRSKP